MGVITWLQQASGHTDPDLGYFTPRRKTYMLDGLLLGFPFPLAAGQRRAISTGASNHVLSTWPGTALPICAALPALPDGTAYKITSRTRMNAHGPPPTTMQP